MKMQDLSNFFFQNPFIGITVTDCSGKCVMVNNVHSKITGIPRSEMIGKSFKKFVDGQVFSVSSTLEVLNTKKEVELFQFTEKGYAYGVKSFPIFNDEGEIEYVVSFLVDATITEDFFLSTKRYNMVSELLEPYYEMKDLVQEGELVCCSKKMKDLIGLAKKVASSDATILITGPSGTGKELVAEILHENSLRKGKPFLRINCAAIPSNLMESELFGYEAGAFTGGKKEGYKGIFWFANGGTLFLDEIAEMPLNLQSKLLRVLQNHEFKRLGGEKVVKVDVRIIAATNASVLDMVKQKQFREDLYYRLNVINLRIPPLSERKEDVPLLAAFFLDEFNKRYDLHKRITRQAISFLAKRSFEGNVRELKNIMERLVLQSENDVIGINDMVDIYTPQESERPGAEAPFNPMNINGNAGEKSLKDMLSEYEKNILKSLIEEYKSPTTVAKLLKIDRSTLYRKLKGYNIL